MRLFPDELLQLGAALLQECAARGVMIATAESCTGGLIAGCLTEIAGSSRTLERGFVTYSNAAKTEMLGVPEALIARHGAVSEPVARAMAEGAAERAGVPLTIAVTGVAGPGGGTREKPVGLVHFGCTAPERETATAHHIFPGDRAAIRLATVREALVMMRDRLHS